MFLKLWIYHILIFDAVDPNLYQLEKFQSSQMVESALRDSIACFKIEDFHNLDHGQKNLSTRNWLLGTFVFAFLFVFALRQR